MDPFWHTLIATIAGGVLVSIPQVVNARAERKARREELYLQMAKDLAPLIEPHVPLYPDLKSILADFARCFHEIRSLDKTGRLTREQLEEEMQMTAIAMNRLERDKQDLENRYAEYRAKKDAKKLDLAAESSTPDDQDPKSPDQSLEDGAPDRGR